MNIVRDIRDTLGLDVEQIKLGILQHCPGSASANASFEKKDQSVSQAAAVNPNLVIDHWFLDSEQIPKWAKQAAARWVLEMWQEERDACTPSMLLSVDKKFTYILRGYSMAEIIALRNTLERNRQVELE